MSPVRRYIDATGCLSSELSGKENMAENDNEDASSQLESQDQKAKTTRRRRLLKGTVATDAEVRRCFDYASRVTGSGTAWIAWSRFGWNCRFRRRDNSGTYGW